MKSCKLTGVSSEILRCKMLQPYSFSFTARMGVRSKVPASPIPSEGLVLSAPWVPVAGTYSLPAPCGPPGRFYYPPLWGLRNKTKVDFTARPRGGTHGQNKGRITARLCGDPSKNITLASRLSCPQTEPCLGAGDRGEALRIPAALCFSMR